MIGDKNSDIQAGRAAGVLTFLVETGYGWCEKRAASVRYVVPDLSAVVDHIMIHNAVIDTETPRG
jgi:phosphoglycolate phosphatase-like HAD superfamily hydrolase